MADGTIFNLWPDARYVILYISIYIPPTSVELSLSLCQRIIHIFMLYMYNVYIVSSPEFGHRWCTTIRFCKFSIFSLLFIQFLSNNWLHRKRMHRYPQLARIQPNWLTSQTKTACVWDCYSTSRKYICMWPLSGGSHNNNHEFMPNTNIYSAQCWLYGALASRSIMEQYWHNRSNRTKTAKI